VKLDLALNKKLINNVPMFQDLSKNCILAIISRLEPRVNRERFLVRGSVSESDLQIYLPQEFVCLKGEKATEMFFILRGRVEVLIDTRTRKDRVVLKGFSARNGRV
jgi:hypothetical protein